MKLSIKQSPIGKPSRISGKTITFGWQSADMTPAQIIAHIEQGKPFAVAQFTDGHRSSDHFMMSSIIALDVDQNNNNTPLTENEASAFIAHPYIQQNAFAIIESFNSKPDAYKFRVLFHLSETVTDAADYAALVELVQREVPFADPAAKDAARAFMGGKPGRSALYTNIDAILNIAPLREVAAHEKSERESAYLERLNQAKELPGTTLQTIEQALGFDGSINRKGWSRQAFVCPVGSHEHDHQTPSAYWHPEMKVLHCFKCGETHLAKDVAQALGIEWKHEKQPKPDIKKKKKRKKSGKEKTGKTQKNGKARYTPLPTPSPDIRIKLSFISDYDTREMIETGGAWLIKSEVGTGKTELVKRMIDQLRQQDRTGNLYLCPRISLSDSAAERLHLEDYQGLTGRQRAQAAGLGLAIVINSLLSLPDGGALPTLDLLILDEIEQLLAQLAGNTLKGNEPQRVHEILRHLVKSAKIVIGLDAGIGSISYEWLKELRPDLVFIENEVVGEKAPLFLRETRLDALNALDTKLKDNNGVVVLATNSLETAKDVYHRYKDQFAEDEIYCVSSETSATHEARDLLKNINERLPQMRLLIYTPSVQTGFDITCPVKAVVGIFTSAPLIASDMLQMIGRCRHPESVHVWVANHEIKHPHQTDRHKIYKSYHTKYLNEQQRVEAYITPDGCLDISDSQKRLLKLVSHIEAERNHSRNNLLADFKHRAQKKYTICELVKNPLAALQKDIYKEVREVRKEHEKDMVLTVDPIDPSTHREKSAAGDITPEDNAGLERWKIQRIYRQDITEDIYSHYSGGIGGRQLLQYCDLVTDREQLIQYSYEELRNRKAPHQLQHRAEKADILTQAFKLVWGDGLTNTDQLHHEKLTLEQIERGMERFKREYGHKLKHYFKRRSVNSDNPLDLLRWLLKRVGLQLELIRKGKSVGMYRVSNQSLTTMRAYVKTRFDVIDDERVRDAVIKDNSIPKNAYHADDWRYTA